MVIRCWTHPCNPAHSQLDVAGAPKVVITVPPDVYGTNTWAKRWELVPGNTAANSPTRGESHARPGTKTSGEISPAPQRLSRGCRCCRKRRRLPAASRRSAARDEVTARRFLGSLAIGQLEAMRGNFERARLLYRRSRALLDEFGWLLSAALTSLHSSVIELLAGDLAAAESELRKG